ncbi:hypothetical protein HRG_013559 [Hirsutella rhossiliensis]
MAPGVDCIFQITSNKRRHLRYKEGGDFIVDSEAISFGTDPYHESMADNADTHRDCTPSPQFVCRDLLRIIIGSRPMDAHLR